MTELTYKGQLVGHNGWVTCIATSSKSADVLVSGSRGNKKYIISQIKI
jgi:guanine nucleotide-binding protein subunit beta-2-like 1 protein